ncbi:hypothetical protein [Meiothermus phage MMP17]|nr:hypothetical protein [Meiothermus phage MMP17]
MFPDPDIPPLSQFCSSPASCRRGADACVSRNAGGPGRELEGPPCRCCPAVPRPRFPALHLRPTGTDGRTGSTGPIGDARAERYFPKCGAHGHAEQCHRPLLPPDNPGQHHRWCLPGCSPPLCVQPGPAQLPVATGDSGDLKSPRLRGLGQVGGRDERCASFIPRPRRAPRAP